MGVEAASHRQTAGTSIAISCAWLEACMRHGQKCVSTAYRLKCFRPRQPEAEGVTSRYDGDKRRPEREFQAELPPKRTATTPSFHQTAAQLSQVPGETNERPPQASCGISTPACPRPRGVSIVAATCQRVIGSRASLAGDDAAPSSLANRHPPPVTIVPLLEARNLVPPVASSPPPSRSSIDPHAIHSGSPPPFSHQLAMTLLVQGMAGMGEGLGYELDVRIMRVFLQDGGGGVWCVSSTRLARRHLLLLLRDSDLCRRSTESL